MDAGDLFHFLIDIVYRNRPFGEPNWAVDTAKQLGLEWTIQPRGRP